MVHSPTAFPAQLKPAALDRHTADRPAFAALSSMGDVQRPFDRHRQPKIPASNLDTSRYIAAIILEQH